MAKAIISEVRSFNPKRLSLDLAIVAAEAAPTRIVLVVGGASAPNRRLNDDGGYFGRRGLPSQTPSLDLAIVAAEAAPTKIDFLSEGLQPRTLPS
jgi:hypothetical protein